MRVPHHLIRTPAGFSFRLRVPTDLRALLSRVIIKRSLGTRDMRAACAFSLLLAARYAAAFDTIRGNGMDDELAAKLLAGIRGKRLHDFTLERDANGTLRIQADPGEDAAALNSAIESIGRVDRSFFAGQSAPAAPAPTVSKVLTLLEARDLYMKAIAHNTIPKTFTIKKTAVDGFVRHAGPHTSLPTITRVDLSGWFQSLRDAGKSTPTLVNRQSYLAGFFDWVMGAGYYPKGDNPARGHVVYSAREKRARRGFGFQPFTVEQIQTLFAPTAVATLSPAARWAALVLLYTGARASEAGQLAVSDVREVEGVPCIHITDEGEHQRLKSDASIRVVPAHPDLVALGFLDYVGSLPADGRLFPKAKADAVNGAGNWISKAFSRHITDHGPTMRKGKGKRGLHSLRKSIIQQMQGLGVADEMRAQICGHELDDEHHATYSRDFTAAEKLHGLITKKFKTEGLAAVRYDLDMDGLRPLLG